MQECSQSEAINPHLSHSRLASDFNDYNIYHHRSLNYFYCQEFDRKMCCQVPFKVRRVAVYQKHNHFWARAAAKR